MSLNMAVNNTNNVVMHNFFYSLVDGQAAIA